MAFRHAGELGLSMAFLVTAIVAYLAVSGVAHQPTISREDERFLLDSADITRVTVKQTRPTRMILPTLNLGIGISTVSVKPAEDYWPLGKTEVQYADFTPRLGSERGTMLLYGHNSWPVLRKSNDLRLGDELVLVDQADQQWRFRLSGVRNVTPEQVGFIYEDTPFRVVVFTCNGWNDEYRRLMYFEPVR